MKTDYEEMANVFDEHAEDSAYLGTRAEVIPADLNEPLPFGASEFDLVACALVAFQVRCWREPLTSLCAAVASARFLIERLVEPLPAASMRERWPEEWEKLRREPGFVVLRLVKP